MDQHGGMARPVDLAPWHWSWPELSLDLLVSAPAAAVFAAYRQSSHQVERGGQLFVDVQDPRGLLLSVATPPNRADRAGVTWLDLDPDRCRREVASSHRNGLQLVGVWHTHAELNPQLSRQDLTSLNAYGQANAFWPLAVVVGQGDHPSEVRAWSVRDGRPLAATMIDDVLSAAARPALSRHTRRVAAEKAPDDSTGD